MELAQQICEHLRSIIGIRDVFILTEADSFALLDIEVAAEKKAFMGMGKMYNSGIREVLQCKLVLVAITDMNLNWGFQTHMLLKRDDDEVVGEEVHDPKRIAELQKQVNVSFLHKNFAIYKDRLKFPQDIIEKKCYFEIPAHSGDDALPGLKQFGHSVFCFPSTPGDVFLKQQYYDSVDEHGTGTMLVGFTMCH